MRLKGTNEGNITVCAVASPPLLSLIYWELHIPDHQLLDEAVVHWYHVGVFLSVCGIDVSLMLRYWLTEWRLPQMLRSFMSSTTLSLPTRNWNRTRRGWCSCQECWLDPWEGGLRPLVRASGNQRTSCTLGKVGFAASERNFRKGRVQTGGHKTISECLRGLVLDAQSFSLHVFPLSKTG